MDYEEQKMKEDIDSLHERLCRAETALYHLLDVLYDFDNEKPDIDTGKVIEIQQYLMRKGFCGDTNYPKN